MKRRDDKKSSHIDDGDKWEYKLPANSGNRWYSIPVLANHSNCTVCIFIPFFRTLSREEGMPAAEPVLFEVGEPAEAACSKAPG